MWTWYRRDRRRQAIAEEGILEALGGRFALESNVRAFLESLWRRPVRAGVVRSRTDGLIEWIRERWWVEGGNRDAAPSAAFVRAHLADWQAEQREATHASRVESIYGALWVGVPTGLLLGAMGVPTLYAVLVGTALTVFAALMWPRWKRRGRIEWGDA